MLKKETKRSFSRSTWVPLRASQSEINDLNLKDIGYCENGFYLGSVAIAKEHRETGEKLDWMSVGIGHSAKPCAFEDGSYKAVDKYQYNDNETIGVELVFEHPQPVVGKLKWVINPDLYIALRLIQDGGKWVRPEEDFTVVIREKFDKEGNHALIEIKKEFLLDYLAARNLGLRLSYYYQRVENVLDIEKSQYQGLQDLNEERDAGRFEFRVRTVDGIWGGNWFSCRVWRTDCDDEEDAPVLEPESESNTDSETKEGKREGFQGYQVEGEFWRNEWIDHDGLSIRVRGDDDPSALEYIIETDRTSMKSCNLNKADIGRWIWFTPSVICDFVKRRGFELHWCTKQTGGLWSASGYSIHFGINDIGLLTVYAKDVAQLPSWEQRIWISKNVLPEGGVSKELFDSQVRVAPASTKAPEVKLLEIILDIDGLFEKIYNIPLFTESVNRDDYYNQISRFHVSDQSSLLRLAKELIRIFSDRLNVNSLRKISTRDDKSKLGSNKLFESIISDLTSSEHARSIFGPVFGVYDLRVGDAHPTSSNITDAYKRLKINSDDPYIFQGMQMIDYLSYSIWHINKVLFDKMNEGDSK